MNKIEEEAIACYSKNLDFLKKYHNETFHKIDILQNRIENSIIKEKYMLEYTSKGYFDVKEIKSNAFLYADNSIEISKQLETQVNFKKTNYSFQGFSLVKNYESADLNDTAQSHEGIYPIMSYYLNHYPYETTMKEIEKFIFFGVGLGLHIEQINQKIDAEHYIIIEDDLELFRLSLFVTPYYKFFSKKNVIFSINTNKEDFNRDFRNFLETSFYLNRLLKYSYFPAHSENKLQLIKNILASQNFLTFGYKTVLKKILKPLDFINQEYNVLNLSSRLNLQSLQDKPLLIIGAGPSLQTNIKWLQEHQNEFIIFAVATSLKTLYTYNIKPDIISHIDGFEAGYKNFEGFDIQTFVKDSIVLLGSFVEERVRNIFNKDKIFMLEEDTFYFSNFTSVAAPCIGSTSVANALLFGCTKIYLLGLDLALSKDGYTHTQEHASNNGKYNVQDTPNNQMNNTISLRGDVFTIRGNFANNVKTTPLFYSSINSINNSLQQLSTENQTVYNLSDGAYIKNSLPLQPQEVQGLQKLDKKNILNAFEKELKVYSKNKLDANDIMSLKKRLTYAKEAKKIIDAYRKNVFYSPINKYLYNLYGLVIDLFPQETRENRNLTHIFDSFFQYTIPIIYDMTNTKETQNTIHKDIMVVDKLLIKELQNITNIYIENLEKFLKEKS
jgi:hypothetical protein